MHTSFLRSAAICAMGVFLASALAVKPARAASACDRECLNGFVDQYLTALAARDTSKVPVAGNVRFTENGTLLKFGEGLWGTANGLGTFRLYTADPAAGQVGFIGVVKEWDRPAILVLRLKVQDGKITEIETIVNRDIPGATALDKIATPDSVLTQAIPAAERASREELVKISNMYFSGLERGDGKGVYPFTADCNRIEGGTQTTNNPALDAPRPFNYPIFSMGCEAQFKTGFFKFVTRIRDRRFMVVDHERGLVFAFCFFDHNGTVRSLTLNDGSVWPESLRHPFTWEIGVVFRIEKGKIRFIQGVPTQAQYGLKPGWGPGSATARASWAVTTPKPPAAAGSGDCDRKCLNGFMNKFRAALLEHDPSRLPLTKDARYTENGQELKVGDGLWGTLDGFGGYQLFLDDPKAGQVSFVGTTDEGGMGGILIARVKVVEKKISEMEVILTRKETAAGFTRPENLTNPQPALLEDLDSSDHPTRQQLVDAADLYFEAIEKSSGKLANFDKDVTRIENGTQTCPSNFAGSKLGQLDCEKQLDTHLFEYITPIRPRRYTTVDEQKGLVIGVFMFNTPGMIRSVEVPGVGKVDESAAATRPFSEEVAELFKIKNGKIHDVVAVMVTLPFGADSNWSDTKQ
ncbi:MAG TPA: hypothetical protein VN822_07940 [Candidatus Acidoferrales bacterium]|nr:hypothetical protein [Candidatus Acidoferrales bacterium]